MKHINLQIQQVHEPQAGYIQREPYAEVPHNQTVETQREREKLGRTQRKTTHSIKRY